MATTAIEFKSRLKEVIQGLPSLADPDIVKEYGEPTRLSSKKEIFLGKIIWESNEWVTNCSMEEIYTIDVVVICDLFGGDQEECEQLAVSLTEELEDTLQNNPTLSMTLPRVVNTKFDRRSLDTGPLDNSGAGYRSVFECGVVVTGRP